MFDIFEWAESSLGKVRRRRASIEADCPFCGKAGHLYIHAEKGYFRCYAKNCGESGRDLSKLIAETSGISLSEAKKSLFRQAVNFQTPRKERLSPSYGPAAASVRLRNGGASSVAENPDGANQGPSGPSIPVPRSTVPVWDGDRWRMPKYLLARGVTRRIAARYNLGYCTDRLCSDAPTPCNFLAGEKTCLDFGRCRYADRIILPIECPAGQAFTARTVIPEERLRYLNPPFPKGRLLYGWKQAVKPEIEIVLVEGPFDAIRLASHGIASVAVMGLFLSPDQRDLLASVRFTAITIMLDYGVVEDAYKMARSLSGLDSLIFIASLPAGCDPGETDKETAWRALRQATEYKASREKASGRLNFRPRLLEHRMGI